MLSVLATTLGALVFTTTPALAAGGHVFKESFTGEGTHKLSDPSGVAVNNVTGNVYVLDKGNNRVEEFNPTGTKLEAEFNGGGTAGALSEPEAIAIDNSGETAAEDPSVGDLYVTDHSVVDKFSSEGKYEGQITGTCENKGEVPPSCSKFTAFEAAVEGVAVDPRGVVWVSQEHTYIDAFSDAQPNAFLFARSNPVLEELKPEGLAVNSEDDLYVGHRGESGFFFIEKLNSMAAILETGGTGNTGIAVESSSNNVYVDRGSPEGGTPEIRVYSPTEGGIRTSPVETFGEAQLADGGGTALAVSYAPVSGGDVYVVDSTAGKVDIFTPPKAAVHAESFSFGGKGAGPSQFTEPLGIAVNDETEDVYVVDHGNKRVEELGKKGEFIAEFAPPGGFEDPEHIAIDNSGDAGLDPSNGDVYVADTGRDVIDKFSATGVYEGQLPGACSGENETIAAGTCEPSNKAVDRFVTIQDLFVNGEGNVYVRTTAMTVGGAGGRFTNLVEFNDSGGFVIAFPLITSCLGGEAPGLAIDRNDNVYMVDCEGEILEANLGGSGGLIRFGGGTSALAIFPATGDLLVDTESAIDEYAPVTGPKPSPLETFPSTGLQESRGIAVGPTGSVYATERTADDVKVFGEYPLAQVAVGAVADLRPTSVTLQGSVDPEGATVGSCEFEYGTATSYGQRAECEPAAGSLGKEKAAVQVNAEVSGLASGTTYHYRLIARNALGTNRGSDHVFTTLGPEISGEHVASVEATSATLQAQIDPHGGATSYHFEYDTTPYTSSAPHGTDLPVPNASVGSGTSIVPVSVKAQGLQPDTTYYYRAVAESEPLGAPEAFYGANETFATPVALGSEPPQSCPNEKLRAEQPFGLKLPDCRAYEMVSPVQTEGQDATLPSSPASRAAVSGNAVTYASEALFGEATGGTLLNQFLSRREPEKDRWSTRSIVPLHNPKEIEITTSYFGDAFTPELTEGVTNTNDALVAGAPNGGGVGSPGTGFGMYVAGFGSGSYQYVAPGVILGGASSDLSRVVLAEGGSEWIDGTIVPVMVTNEGEAIGGAVGAAGGGPENLRDLWHAVSSDGSRVYFTSPANTEALGVRQLFVRVNIDQPHVGKEQSELNSNEECTEPTKACTIEISASASAARYWGASADGTKVFYTEGEDLYEYSLPAGQVSGGQRTAITVGGKVQGVAQISEDGSYVYFVAEGELATGATPGQPNLYVSHEGGSPRFITTLGAGDSIDWDSGGFSPEQEAGPEINTAVVNPSGTRMAFISSSSLTGYDNHDANTGRPDAEIYLYDTETGRTSCASCNPTGARPVGPSSFSEFNPQATYLYRPRNLLDSGALFFDSSDALVPHASDGRGNVYEYEDGRVRAISNVAGGEESFFLDASVNGDDVFFGSADQLLPQDKSENLAVWDARVDGGFPVAAAAPACTTAEACRVASPPTPSVFGAPPSATFSGPGNVIPGGRASNPVVKPKPKSKTVKCKRGFVKKKVHKKETCVKKKRPKKSAHTNRRLSR